MSSQTLPTMIMFCMLNNPFVVDLSLCEQLEARMAPTGVATRTGASKRLLAQERWTQLRTARRARSRWLERFPESVFMEAPPVDGVGEGACGG